MDMNFGAHTSSRFNEELEEIRSQVLEMGGIIEQQIKHALVALEKADSESGKIAIELDNKVNEMEVDIDEMCTRIIAQRQPTAKDLRLIVSTFKTINDLERIGDEAQRVANMACRLASEERPRDNYSELRHLGILVSDMLKGALDAYARSDDAKAAEILIKDEEADIEYEALIRQSMTFMMQDTKTIPRFMNVIWAARALERIGDRACNISEYVIYFVKGKDVRHLETKDQISISKE